jgi:hypothetical protein
MKKYRFIGSEEQAETYSPYAPKVGKVYSGEAKICHSTAEYWANRSWGHNEWEEVVGDELVGEVDPFEAFMEGLIFGLVGEKEYPIAVKVLEKYKLYKNV